MFGFGKRKQIEREVIEEVYPGSRADSLIEQLANDRVAKLESIPFKNLNSSVEDVFYNSDIQKIRREIGRKLSKLGSIALIALPYNKTFILATMEVHNIEMIGRNIISITGTTGASYMHDNTYYALMTKYYFDDETGKPILQRYIIVETKDEIAEITIGENYVFNADELPVEYFLNNDEGINDIDYANVHRDLERLRYFDDRLRADYERARSQPSFNLNFTDNDPKTETKAIDNGRGYLVEDSFNAKLGAGTTIIPANNGAISTQQLILFIEDDLRNKLALKRDGLEGGTNKHNLEVVMKEQFAIEQLIINRSMRENHWNSFIKKISGILNVKSENKITLEISPIEQAKLDLLRSTVLEAKMKASNVAGQINADNGLDISETKADN